MMRCLPAEAKLRREKVILVVLRTPQWYFCLICLNKNPYLFEVYLSLSTLVAESKHPNPDQANWRVIRKTENPFV